MNLRSNLKFVAQPKTPLSKRSNKRKECDATSSSSQDGKISYVRYVTELQKLQTDNELLRLQVRELTDEHQSNEPPRKVRFAGPARWKKNVIALTEAESKIRRLEIDNSTLEENINKLRTEHEETVNQLDWMRRQMPSLSRNHSFQDGMLPKKKNNQTDKPNVWRLVIASSESEDSDLLADNDIMPELEVMQFPKGHHIQHNIVGHSPYVKISEQGYQKELVDEALSSQSEFTDYDSDKALHVTTVVLPVIETPDPIVIDDDSG